MTIQSYRISDKFVEIVDNHTSKEKDLLNYLNITKEKDVVVLIIFGLLADLLTQFGMLKLQSDCCQ